MKKLLTIPALAILSLAIIGCPPKAGENGNAAASDQGGEILVGEYGSLTGSEATFGQSTHNAIMLAVDEINAAGGVNGRKIRVLTEDDQSKADEAANAVTKLISQNNVVAVLGEVASSNSLAAAPICQSNKIPMITPSSTNPTVTEKGDYIFRMCFLDSYQGASMANYILKTLNMKKVAVLIDNKSDYSTGLAKFFSDAFTGGGGQIVATQSYAKGDADFRSQLTAIKAANPDVIYVPGYYNDIGQIAIQARDLGMQQPLAGGDGWESPKLIEIGGKALEGCFYSNHYFAGDPAPAVRDFVDKYKQRYNATPDSLAALAYDAARVLADAVKRAGKTDGSALRDAIGSTKGFSGVTGTINLGADRNPQGKKLVIVEIKNGQLALKASVDPAAQGGGAAAPATGTATSTTDTTGTTGSTGSVPTTATTRTQ
ncbi:MAG TPA: ABC transporter substrate-binding protein [Thermoanaerobaculia bacterium]|jgi:branched-chain amino acid transport system substrate-binding protein